MNFKYPNSKKLYLAVEISQLLYKYECTYNEADEILQLIINEIKQQREDKEYNTIDDFLNSVKNCCADHEVIEPLKHVELYV